MASSYNNFNRNLLKKIIDDVASQYHNFEENAVKNNYNLWVGFHILAIIRNIFFSINIVFSAYFK